jgi:protein SCO1/2
MVAVLVAVATETSTFATDVPRDTRPAALRNVGFDQRLGASVPLDASFRDESGAAVTLGSLLRGKPVVLVLAYYECPMLCTLVLNGLVSAMNALPFTVGDEYDVITVSIDPRETPAVAAAKKETYLSHYRRPDGAAGWHFLTGEASAVERLAEAVGFRYQFIPERNEYAHAAGLTVLTPRGQVARYFYGVEFAPRDLRFGLIEAADDRIGSPVDQLLLYCYQYDPSSGRYSTAVLTAVRAAGVLTVLGLAVFVWRAWRREGEAAAESIRPPAARLAGRLALPGRPETVDRK